MRRETWWLAALLVLMAFAFQGSRGIFEPDEGRYTATGLNMLASGDWLVPTVDGEHPHLTKPPITYWAIAASVGALGRNEWAARLPGALAFVGTGLLVLGLGRRLCPGKPWLPAAIWALSLAPVIGANIVSTDALLVLFETAAMFAFVEAWRSDGAARRRWLAAMWTGWGLAFMTKGPPGLLPLLAMVVMLAIHDRARLRGLFTLPGLALFAVTGLTWYGLVVWQEPGRLAYFLGYEVYDRVFTAEHNRNAQWYGAIEIYLPILALGALPWSVLALRAAGGPRAAWRRLRERLAAHDVETRLLAYWFLLPLLVFCLARSRLQLYVLPLFVPLALVMARTLADWAWLDRRRFALAAGTTACLLLALKGALAGLPMDRDARRMAQQIAHVVDLHDIEEIAFLDMRGFFGLGLYLDVRIESVRIGGHQRPHSRLLPSDDDLCDELDEHEANIYAVKRARLDRLRRSLTDCGPYVVRELGEFQGDGHDIALVDLRPAAR